MGERVRVLETVVVEPGGKLRLPSRDQWKRALRDAGPGEYAVVPLGEVLERRVAVPLKRMFHLGDLAGRMGGDASARMCEADLLSGAGLRTSDQVRAAGAANLETLLVLVAGSMGLPLRDGKELAERLVQAFGRLGVPVPPRGGVVPSRPSAEERDRIRDEYAAHAEVWRVRDGLVVRASAAAQSSFVQHAAGLDIVCGACGAQHVGVPEERAAGLVCTKCGNDLGVDLVVERAARPLAAVVPK